MVALSGNFCFPANPHRTLKVDTPHNPLVDMPNWQHPLDIAGTTYDCPAIHFVTGMVEKADDPSKLLIAYGVEDCTSWFVVVHKADAIDLLFSHPNVPL